MKTHAVVSTTGEEWEFIVDDDGRMTGASGPWPAGVDEVTFEGPMPFAVASEPAVVAGARRAAAGWEVCFHSDHPCQTCYCSPSGAMRCEKMC